MFRNAPSSIDAEPRDSVRDVEPFLGDLTYEQCEEWARQQGYEWEKVVREAGVGSKPSNILNLKSRWKKGDAPEARARIREKLLEMETKRKERTPIGRRVLALDEWNRIGEALAMDPDIIEREIAKLRGLADNARVAAEAERVALAARAKLDESINESMKTLRSITPAPKPPRR